MADGTRRPVTARSRLRPKAQLTLPEAIRAALRIGPGDEVEFTVGEDGTVTVRGWTLVPADRVRPDAGAGGQDEAARERLEEAPGGDA